MENIKNKNTFLISCVSCIVLLLVMCYFGVNNSVKGTSAVTVTCGDKEYVQYGQNRWCCPNSTDEIQMIGNDLYCVVKNDYNFEVIAASYYQGSAYACIGKSSTTYESTPPTAQSLCDEIGSEWEHVSDGGDVPNKTLTAFCSAPLSSCAVLAEVPEEVSDVYYKVMYYYNNGTEKFCESDKKQGKDYTIDSRCNPEVPNNCKLTSWNTDPNGLGTTYRVGDVYKTDADLNLYAQHSCDYRIDADAGDGYIVSHMGSALPNGTKTDYFICTAAALTSSCRYNGDLVAELDGYTFTGWGTTSDCTSGKPITDYFVNKDTTFYACYTKNGTSSDKKTVDIIYNANNPWFSSVNSIAVDINSKFEVTSDNPFKTFSNGKYSECQLNSWNTKSDLTGTKYQIGEEYPIGSSDLNLYADYRCPVDYVLDAGEGEVYSFVSNKKEIHGKSHKTTAILGPKLSEKELSLYYAELDGHTFKGWGTSEGCVNGNTSSDYTFKLSEFPKINTIYACYIKNEIPKPTAQTFNVTFKDYDGTELGSDSCTTSGSNTWCTVEALSSNPTRDNHTFIGWSQGGNDCTTYKPWKQSLDVSGSISVYACYTSVSIDIEAPSGSEFVDIIADAGNGYISDVSGVTDLGTNRKTYKQSCLVSDTKTKCGVAGEVTASLDGYKFTGWGTSKGCTNGKSITDYTVSKTTTYYACYTKNQVTEDDKNVGTNPGTGEITIFIVWVIGIAAIVYSIWYFRKNKENN